MKGGLDNTMMLSGLNMYINRMFPDSYVQLVFLLTLSAILTWWFLKGLLNPFIKAALAILAGAINILLTFFFRPTSRILLKALFYTIFGITVFAIDHRYGTRLFETNETLAYVPMEIYEITFWVSQPALWIGGFSLGLSVLYIGNELMKWLNHLLDRTLCISIVFTR